MKKRNLTTAALVLACGLSLTACSGSGADATTAAETTASQTTAAETTAAEETTTEEAASATSQEAAEAETEKASEDGAKLRIGQEEGAAHGDECVTGGTAVIDENDSNVAAVIDE